MFDGDGLDAADRRIDDWQAGIEQQATQARLLSGRLAALTATARSADGLVRVTLAASGAVTAIDLDDEVRRQPAARTGRDIVATIRAAERKLADQAAEAVAETVGTDGPTGQAVLGSFTTRFGHPDGDDSDDER